MTNYFKNIPEIKYEGENSSNPLAFKFYDEDSSGTQTIFINESILQNLANLVTFNNVNLESHSEVIKYPSISRDGEMRE